MRIRNHDPYRFEYRERKDVAAPMHVQLKATHVDGVYTAPWLKEKMDAEANNPVLDTLKLLTPVADHNFRNVDARTVGDPKRRISTAAVATFFALG